MKPKRLEFPDFAGMKDGWLLYLKHMPTVVGETAVNFFKDSFNRQGFIDKGFERWTPRKDKLVHKILMKSLYLQNSIQVIEASHNRVEVAPVTNTNYNYAQIHNEGGTIKRKAYSRAVNFYIKKTGQSRFAKKSKANFQQDIKFKEATITIPKRQFIGESEFLMKRLELNNKKTIDNIIQKHFKNS